MQVLAGAGVEIADDDALADVGAGDLAELVGLLRIGDAEACEAAVEPETGEAGEIGASGRRAQIEQDAHVAAAGLTAEVVEIVEGSDGGIERLGMGGVGLDVGEQDGVGAERMDVVEALGDAFEAFGAEAVRVDLINDGVLPPCHRTSVRSLPSRDAQASARMRGRMRRG